MGKDIKKNKDAMGRLYREFSRQKYNKYKHQFPRMRQSDIIAKIIKEWEKLDEESRVNLQKEYIERNFLAQEKSDSDASKEKKTKKDTPAPKNKQTSKPESKPESKSEPIKIFKENVSEKAIDDSDRDPLGSNKDRQSESDRSLGDADKTKKIKKTNVQSMHNGEYLQFFKYYYERLSQQHSKWTPVQISTIIKLLWKKRNSQIKKKSKGKVPKVPRISAAKRISGRMAFKKAKGEKFSTNEIFSMWKKLPRQSKVSWEKQGRGWESLKKPNTFVTKLKAMMKGGVDHKEETETLVSNNFSFMNRTIQ